MTGPRAARGVLYGGLPYNRLGHGPRVAVAFQGLQFQNRSLPPWSVCLAPGSYGLPGSEFTTYIVTRRHGLPDGYTLADMAGDYAAMVRTEFGRPVDVIGVSTGGSIAQHFAADHPDLVRTLVLHSAAHTLGELGKRDQLLAGQLARSGDWPAANRALMRDVLPHSPFTGPVLWLLSHLTAHTTAGGRCDLAITVEAEDQHDFRDRLAEIGAPTLVVAGAADPFYSEQLFRETAAGIPDSRLILYPGMGHPASGRQFRRDVLAFLRERG